MSKRRNKRAGKASRASRASAPLVIIRDDQRVARLKQVSQILFLVGLACFVGGLFALFQNQIALQLAALAVGFIALQIATYLAPRYVREPRPDQTLDALLRKSARDSRLYHYILPPPHVLLTPAGPIILHAKYQVGNMEVTRDRKGRDRWKQRGIGFMRRIFGQESVGNPTREAEILLSQLAAFIRKQAPEIKNEEIPIGVIIVFTSERIGELKTAESSFPVVNAKQLKSFLHNQGPGDPLPQAQYDALRSAFDKKAGDTLESN